jgi:hypothetical protein
LSHTVSPFCFGYFGDGTSQTICLSWPRTMILLISDLQVARSAGMSHWHLALFLSLNSTKMKYTHFFLYVWY